MSVSDTLNFVILGLRNSGKTTALYRLTLNQYIETEPTIDYNMASMKYKEKIIHITDYSLDDLNIINSSVNGIVFMVDMSDKEKIEPSKKFFIEVNKLADKFNLPLVILFNKQDLLGMMDIKEISDAFTSCMSTPDENKKLRGASAKSGYNLIDAIDFLVTHEKPKPKPKPTLKDLQMKYDAIAKLVDIHGKKIKELLKIIQSKPCSKYLVHEDGTVDVEQLFS